MEKPIVLIADSDPASCRALACALEDRYCVRCCGSGRQSLDLIRQLGPDILVLDLMLPELDGLSVLQTISTDIHRPKVLAVTYVSSNYIMDTARALGVDYIMRRPCEIKALAMRVDDLYRRPVCGREEINGLLKDLGFDGKHNGYQCLQIAIELYAADPSQPVTKELYPEVGKRCGSPIDRKLVERQIRYAISVAWNKQTNEAREKYFPGGKRPSNREFIAKASEILYDR